MNKKVRSILFSVLTTALITTGSWTGYAVGGFSGQSNLQSQIAKDNVNEFVLAADTVVELDGKILGKPKNREEAFGFLKS